jgi:hypothetical protein
MTEHYRLKADRVIIFLLIVVLIVTIFNQIQIMSIKRGTNIATGMASVSASILPTGVPEIYGEELGISFDDVTPYDRQKADATIAVMADLDRNIELSGDDLERYINIASRISCEYCCGAKALIFSNGKAACGCAHSYAMRGLAKYLITEHGDEYTDEEILSELAKWKTLFFPGQMQAKAQVLEEKGIEVNYVNLGSNKYRGIERGVSGSGMVGGC